MKKILLVLLLMIAGNHAFSQVSIRGNVADKNEKLPAATVLLLQLDSTMVKGAITDLGGDFIFENVAPGSYLISASMVGYAKFYSDLVNVENKDVVIPEIILQDAATTLGEVVVTTEKQLFQQSIDRFVINTASSITLSGNSILEVLQKSPGILVNRQNNSISMNGKSGVRIMINEKLVQVPMDVAFQMLDGMNASNIEKIELISTPPSKYDAEGSAGIIHIVTKTNEDFGTNGTVSLTIGARWAEALGANFNINHRSKKLSSFIDYSITRNHNLHIMKMNRELEQNEFIQTINDHSHRENLTTQQNLNAGLELNISKNSFLNFQLTGFRRNWELDATTTDLYQVNVDSMRSTDLNIYELNLWQSVSGSVGLRTKPDTKSEINLNVDYLYYKNDNISTYDNTLLIQPDFKTELSKIDINKQTPIQFYIVKADYQRTVSPEFSWEAGAKAVTSTLDNNVFVQRMVQDRWIPDPDFSSFSNLREQIGASYFSSKWQPGRKWSIHSGLRYEHTSTTISTPTNEKAVDRKYGYFFPSVFIKKELGTEEDFMLSYSRRITRPTYNDIAPFVFLWGPNTFSSGNTSLYPAIGDAITGTYHVKALIFSLQYTHTQNEIAQWQPRLDVVSNTLTMQSENLKYLNTLALTNNYSVKVLRRWEIQSNVTIQYQTGQTKHLNNNAVVKLYGLNLNLVNIIKLPRDFTIEISGMHQSRTLTGISTFQPLGSVNAGIQKDFHSKGILRLSMDDIFYTNYWRIETKSPENNINTYFNYDWHNQFIKLTYSRNLGRKKINTLNLKSGSDDERKRVGN
jgi:hypothetical protein